MKHLIIYITLLLLAPLLKAQELKVDLDEAMKIGEQITLSLNFQYKGNQGETNIVWPEFTDTITSEVEIIRAGKTETSVLDPDIPILNQNQRFIITSFDTGYIVIPPFQVYFNDSLIESEASLLHVSTVEIDTSKGIADIKPNYEVDYSLADRLNDLLGWLKENWFIPLGVAILIGLLILLFILWRRKKNRPEEKVQLPAHVIALHSLDELSNKKLWTKGQTKEHFVELIQIIRIYIENRYGVRAREKTTGEIINGLKFEPITNDQKATLRNLLSLADLVKFAKEKPIEEDNENSLKKAYEFIEETKFTEEEKKELKKQMNDFKEELKNKKDNNNS